MAFRPPLTRASKITSWHQIQPHPAPNPATPGARSDHTRHRIQQQSELKSTSLHIKSSHTCHEIQPHPVSNTTALGIKLRLTRHQTQPHGTESNHTWYQSPPHRAPDSTTPANKSSHARDPNSNSLSIKSHLTHAFTFYTHRVLSSGQFENNLLVCNVFLAGTMTPKCRA